MQITDVRQNVRIIVIVVVKHVDIIVLTFVVKNVIQYVIDRRLVHILV